MKLSPFLIACLASLLIAGCANTEPAAAKDSPEHNTTFTQKAGDVANTANGQQADNNTATDDTTPDSSRGAEDESRKQERAKARQSLGMH